MISGWKIGGRKTICMVVLVLLLILITGFCFASEGTVIESGIYRLELNPQVDFIMHLFAHIRQPGSPASNYDSSYVKKINLEKQKMGLDADLEQKMKQFSDEIYLQYLTFYAAFFSSTENLLNVLDYLGTGDMRFLLSLSRNDRQLALHLKDGLIKNEGIKEVFHKLAIFAREEFDGFYHSYREQNKKRFTRRLRLFQDRWESSENEVVMSFFRNNGNTSLTIFLSEAMRRNGRGITSSPDSAAAITRLPENEDEFFYSYTIAVHEMLHQIVDRITIIELGLDPEKRSIDPKNPEGLKIHSIMENAVVITQYWLMEAASPEMAKNYLNFFSEITGRKIKDYESLLYCFSLPQELEAELRLLVKRSLES